MKCKDCAMCVKYHPAMSSKPVLVCHLHLLDQWCYRDGLPPSIENDEACEFFQSSEDLFKKEVEDLRGSFSDRDLDVMKEYVRDPDLGNQSSMPDEPIRYSSLWSESSDLFGRSK